MTSRVLVVDDDAGVRFTIRSVLEDEGLDVEEAADGQAALERVDDDDAPPLDLVITDLRMPRLDGMGLLARLQGRPHAPRVVLITAHGDERTAVAAMKTGAFDYFRKPFDIDDLLAVVRRAVETVRLQGENERLQGELNLSRSMVFRSPALSRLAVLVQRVAPRDVTVLITGESGTGKERVAEAIVRASARAARPFVRFNCASLGPELAEAELFGHAKGAFTGAHRQRPGLFREADGGTLLLDEIGELAPIVQARLLRVLQSGEVRPVGEDRPVKVDVRVVAATHRDLQGMVADGSFREDLYYRLAVVHLHLPPLRERPDDLPPLVEHFLRVHASTFGTGPIAQPPELVSRLTALPWPGNVRQLSNTIEMLVALSVDGALDLSLLPDPERPATEDDPPTSWSLKQRMDAYERGLLVEALERTRGVKAEAARQLGISRVTLYDKLARHGLSSDDDR
ncbi:MAG: sigma-54-dependent Fis family transcriptional regulator [Alphaproteobacteria bacterium]|nr:sigma-54-dependent Fis family transcriptional regulator [Alphaproteobacteria bacterium]